MLSPIGWRGSSDANGSWKMICIRRRYGRSFEPVRPVMSAPSKRIVPLVGSMSRRISRPTVVLPQPDSPTRPERLALADLERDMVDGLDPRPRPLHHAHLHREVLDEVDDLDERRPVAAGRRRR